MSISERIDHIMEVELWYICPMYLKKTNGEPIWKNLRIETTWIEVKLRSHDTIICCFYRIDFVPSNTKFNTKMQSSIAEAFNYTPDVILTWDININFLHLTNSQLLDCLTLSFFFFTNIIDEPTRITSNAASLVDLVLVTDCRSVLDSETLNVGGFVSDHKATCFSIQFNMGYTYLNLIDSPELLQILMTLTTVIKFLLPNFLGRAIVILNLELCGLFYEAICCMSFRVSFCSCVFQSF